MVLTGVLPILQRFLHCVEASLFPPLPTIVHTRLSLKCAKLFYQPREIFLGASQMWISDHRQALLPQAITQTFNI